MGPIEIAAGSFWSFISVSVFWNLFRRPRLTRRWDWQRAPRVRFTDDVRPEITKAVVKAIRKAELLGARIDGYCYGGTAIPRQGEIVIVMIAKWALRDHQGLSVTHLDKEDGTARWSVVQLPAVGTTDRVALHELLHCFGFGHVKRRGHLLSDTARRQGEDLTGIVDAFHAPSEPAP